MDGTDPKDMLLFAKVVELGSLTAASSVTGRPKATISRAISRLETRLSARLLERTSRRPVVTEAGRMLYEYCLRVSEALEEAETALGALQATVQGTLRVGASLTIGQVLLKPLIPDFVACHPALRIKIELTNRNIDLVEEGFDVVLRIGPLPDSSLSAIELAVLDYGVYASPGHLAAVDPVAVPEQLIGRRVVDNFAGKPDGHWNFSSRGRSCTVPVKLGLDFNDAIMRRDAIAKGAGLGMVPRWICRQMEAEGALVNVLPAWSVDRSVTIYAVWSGRRHTAPRVRAFLEFLKSNLGPLLGPDAPS